MPDSPADDDYAEMESASDASYVDEDEKFIGNLGKTNNGAAGSGQGKKDRKGKGKDVNGCSFRITVMFD